MRPDPPDDPIQRRRSKACHRKRTTATPPRASTRITDSARFPATHAQLFLRPGSSFIYRSWGSQRMTLF